MGVSEEHLKKLEKNHDLLCEALGIVDDSVKLTYDQCIANFVKCSAQLGDILKIFTTHFEIIDTDEIFVGISNLCFSLKFSPPEFTL